MIRATAIDLAHSLYTAPHRTEEALHTNLSIALREFASRLSIELNMARSSGADNSWNQGPLQPEDRAAGAAQGCQGQLFYRRLVQHPFCTSTTSDPTTSPMRQDAKKPARRTGRVI